MRILITGVEGFAGRHLAKLLARTGETELFGTFHNRKPEADFRGASIKLDLRNFGQVESAVADIRPDEVYHLAGVTTPGEARDDPLTCYNTNVFGALNLLEALTRKAPDAKTLVVSSSEVYGQVDPSNNPVAENLPPNPNSVYSASKRCAELIAQQYARNGLHVVLARPFNHTGPGQSEKFAAPAFATQIAKIEAGLLDGPVLTGPLHEEKDFTDVRDVVAAYPLILRKADRGQVFNVCSGKPTGIRAILDTLISLSSDDSIKHQLRDPQPETVNKQVVIGDGAALFKLAGWRPEIPLEKTLEDLLDDCRRIIESEKNFG